MMHELGIVSVGGTSAAFAAARSVTCIPVGKIVTLTLWGDIVEAVIPFTEVGGLVFGIGLL